MVADTAMTTYLDEMSDHAAALLRAAAGLTAVPDDQLAPWLRELLIETYRDSAAKLDQWRALAREAERALDEIAVNAQEDAIAAERQARQPEAGPFRRAWNDGASSLRSIDDVFAAAVGQKVIPLRPTARVVAPRDEDAAR